MKKIADKVSGIFIPVTDLKRSTAWYKQVFDLETIDQSDICIGLAFPGEATILNLWKVENLQPVQFDAGGYHIPYYNFESFDIEHSFARLQELGVEVTPIHNENDIRHFECVDPDGNLINIVEELAPSPYYPHKQKHRQA